VHWSVDPRDWRRDRTSEVISNSLKNNVGPGDIVLFHDGGMNQEESLKSVAALIDNLKQRGYRFVTVSQLLGAE
jgi:peptidoglycan/xylan/chitin deacetylase (PgdA/CDA1 family)